MSQSSFNILQKIVQHSRAHQTGKQINPEPHTAKTRISIKADITSSIWFDMQLYHHEQTVHTVSMDGTYTITLKSCTEPTSFQDQLYRDGIKKFLNLYNYVYNALQVNNIFLIKIYKSMLRTHEISRKHSQ